MRGATPRNTPTAGMAGPPATSLPPVDPETPSPPDPDLDAIAADLAGVEAALDALAAGTYEHGTEPPAP